MKYIDKLGSITEDDTSQDKLLSTLYTSTLGRLLLKPLVQPAVTKIGGCLLNTRLSAQLIKPFVKKNHIDLSIYCKQTFSSYNDFFTRQIKKEFRPLSMDKNSLISPCDGKLSVFQISSKSQFTIKHTKYSLSSLLRSKKLAARYHEGYACIFRLTVDDYHRFCYMDDGIKSKQYRIPGVFHTVNPIANDVYPIYKENTREFCLLKSEHFGTLLLMEVGALMVGKIKNYPTPSYVKKGQEKGLFEFGGSTILVLLQKDHAYINPQLLIHTEKGYETIVKMGEPIGSIPNNTNNPHASFTDITTPHP